MSADYGSDGWRPAEVAERVPNEKAMPELGPLGTYAPPAVRADLEDDALLAEYGEAPVAEVPDAPLARYLRWQLRDFVTQRAVWLVPALLFLIWLVWYNYDAAQAQTNYVNALQNLKKLPAGQPLPHVSTPLEDLRAGFIGIGWAISYLIALAASYGIVSRERERGLQRFLFAKPVSIRHYYLQKLAVSAAGYFAIVLLGALVTCAVFGTWAALGTVLMVAASIFALVGGITFLLSTLTRFDAPLAAVVLMVSTPIVAISRGPVEFRFRAWRTAARVVRVVLPPVDALQDVFTTTRPWIGLPIGVAWTLAYGAACVAAGVWVLRRRSITT